MSQEPSAGTLRLACAQPPAHPRQRIGFVLALRRRLRRQQFAPAPQLIEHSKRGATEIRQRVLHRNGRGVHHLTRSGPAKSDSRVSEFLL